MIAVKNNKIILQGLGNRQDGLLDIPVHKYNITTQCCIQPHIHVALHRKLVHKTKQYHHTAPKTPTNKALPSHLQNRQCRQSPTPARQNNHPSTRDPLSKNYFAQKRNSYKSSAIPTSRMLLIRPFRF